MPITHIIPPELSEEEWVAMLDPEARAHARWRDSESLRDLRFVPNPVVMIFMEAASVGRRFTLNDLGEMMAKGTVDPADVQEFYRLIGYSLCGYIELFGPYTPEDKDA